jgi:ribosome-binding protein aMBF1 (putative translation factor)
MTKSTKARKYNSSTLQELFLEITPLEMEQTKTKMQLSARMEELMRSNGWNKSQFAEKVGKNPSEITKWFSGTQNFTIDVLTEIAFALGVDISTLFDKKQVQVVYRKEIVVKSVVAQPTIPFATPMGQVVDNHRNHLFSGNQKTVNPFNQYNKI